jgi:hypothetical protein
MQKCFKKPTKKDILNYKAKKLTIKIISRQIIYLGVAKFAIHKLI